MKAVFWIVATLFALVYGVLHLEWRRHAAAVARIPIRIHVNGTRGKSSVTRLIAAMLREAGIVTVARTTGTTARVILPDGAETPVRRDGPPNIRELIRSARLAARLDAQAIVFECMAVAPELQTVAERRIVRPVVTVVTNARLDHTDVQGEDRDGIARSFAVVPGGTLVTADPLVARMQEPRLLASGGRVILADAADGDGEVGRLPFLEHGENVALALAAAEAAGVPRDVARRALPSVQPDPGVATVYDLPSASGPWVLVNLFAANDPDSTLAAVESFSARFGLPARPLFLYASRRDRVARAAEFVAALAERPERFGSLVVWGERTRAVARRARLLIPADRVVDAGSRSPEGLTDLLLATLTGGDGDAERTVIGVGNIIGPAHRWLEHLAQRVSADAALAAVGGRAA